MRGIEGLTNPRGFIAIDKHQRNPAFQNVFAVGVAVAIPPVGKTPLAGRRAQDRLHDRVDGDGRPPTMSRALIAGKEPYAVATWNAVCLADFGDEGIAFIAQPQIPPRNVNWSSSGKWVHAAKVGFEKYFLRKIRQGKSETFYERSRSTCSASRSSRKSTSSRPNDPRLCRTMKGTDHDSRPRRNRPSPASWSFCRWRSATFVSPYWYLLTAFVGANLVPGLVHRLLPGGD